MNVSGVFRQETYIVGTRNGLIERGVVKRDERGNEQFIPYSFLPIQLAKPLGTDFKRKAGKKK